MQHDYSDILDVMTALTRSYHAAAKELGEGPIPHCTDDIDSTTGLCRCEAKPLWYDQSGTPRFKAHHPDLCADIYADEVALVRIACQACAHEFLVQLSRSAHDDMDYLARVGAHGTLPRLLDETLAMLGVALGAGPSSMLNDMTSIAAEFAAQRKRRPPTLAEQVTDGSIHYGDPPNSGCCPAGPTMNCEDLAVVEFWRRYRTTVREGWQRVSELEIALPTADC